MNSVRLKRTLIIALFLILILGTIWALYEINTGINLGQEPLITPPADNPCDDDFSFADIPPEISRLDTQENEVTFTFDAGAGSQSLDVVLAILKKHQLKGTFFLTGKWAEQNHLLVKRISEAGHDIFNHTYSHPHLTQLEDEQIIDELEKANRIICEIINQSTKPYFRAPYGERNERVLRIAAQSGYRSVFWTIDALDWMEESGFTAEQTKARILGNLKPGNIYLMHIGDNITGQILDEVFGEIKTRGYTIVPLAR